MAECAVCHRSSDDVQVRFCTKASMFLCSKHKNQFYRHGAFQNDIKPIRTCEACGITSESTTVNWCSKAGKYLCGKHVDQINRLGYIKAKTKRDRNDYVMHKDYAEILFRDKNQNISGSALIDVEDVDKCRPHKWIITEMIGNSRYVKCNINGVNTSLHRFVLEYGGNLPVDHINRNGLDNRKSNLRVVSTSENIVNSKTRSVTGEKNIYQRGTKYRVQIIRQYKKVYSETFENLQEAIKARNEFIKRYNDAHNRII